ncbi:glycine cleavage system H protein [Halopenitus malekzadehii]|uniref:Probable glycine cleavage system H protein n=1 Tax=Halopenitus malekzadehii TaxID=1267564 RepID=A0A1H6I3Q4_9EURY|nr:glycine cleavage system protein GcvH [Halopenitus malekzadehii]SEH41321.1 glycine cleavage system H protein [Halopenitus malekzadehii]
MDHEIPTDRRYAESHEWVHETDAEGVLRIGISDFAQDELGDIVFAELPREGETFDRGDQFAVVESIKAVSDIYLPVSGTIEAVNEAITDQPELINEDPHGDGWLVEIRTDDDVDHLLTAEEYEEQI